MMRIISWNINGLKSRFDEARQLVETYRPDFLCLQKVRCDAGREQFEIDGYRALYSVEDSGKWSGVMTYAKLPVELQRLETPFLSQEGHLQAFLCNGFALVNAYVPFSNAQLEGAAEYRKQWNLRFCKFIKELSKENPVVICGDLNIVHTVKDTCEHRLEQNRPCFYKWEREDFNSLLQEADLADAFRELHPDEVKPTYYGNYRSTGLGNRIDYFLISCLLLPGVTAAKILTNFGSGQSVPITLDFLRG